MWPSLQLKDIKGKFSVPKALILLYCSSFYGMMRADPAFAGGGDRIINKYIYFFLIRIFSLKIFNKLFSAPEFRRLSPFQRAFAGERSSDHIAMLNVFNSWEQIRMRGEDAEMNFCDYKSLSMPTLRVTWEAKVVYL